MDPESRRIAVLGPFPPLRGGIAAFDRRMATALRRRGHDVTDISFSRLYPDIMFPGRSQFEPGAARDDEAALDSVRPWTWLRTAREIRAMRLDALLIAWWTPVLAPVLTTVARRSKTPVIGIVHNATPHEAMPFAAYLARRFLASCTGVVTMSDGVAAEVERLGFTGAAASTPHPSYEPPGALPIPEAARAALGLPPDGPVLLFFGLVRPYKGLDVLIEALPAVLEAHDGATLVVAGEWYGDQDAIRARMAALGLTGHVRVDDRYVPDDELPTLFSAADLLVQPYRSATQSGVLQLAASFGVPCVVTDVGGLAGPIRRFGAGHVAPPGDAAQLARAVIGALEPGHRDELAEGARAMAAAHGWDAFARAVEDLLARSIPETD